MITIAVPGDPYIVQPSDTLISVTSSPALIVFGPVGAVDQVVTVQDRTPAGNGDISVQVPGAGTYHITHYQQIVVRWDSPSQSWHV